MFAASAAFLALASFFFPGDGVPLAGPEDKAEETKELEDPAVAAPAPVLTLSREVVEQSGAFVARVEGMSGGSAPKGRFLGKEVSFFSVGDSWMAILGVDAKRELKAYPFEADFGDAMTEAVEVRVVRRDFPVTKLAVTPELEEQGYTPATIAENIGAVENKALQEVLGGYTETFFANQPFFYPLNTIRDVGAYGNIRESGSVSLQHLGVDLDAATGTNVYSVNSGRVVLSDDFTNYGKIIVIDHGFGIYSLYLHLDKRFVVVGDSVTRGEIMGHAGNTGYSIAPHLHFSIKAAGESVDPLRFIETVNAEF